MDFGIKEMPHPSRIRKNPFYKDIVSCNPEDVAEIISDLLAHDPDELATFEKYRASQG